MATHHLASWASTLKYSDISPEVVAAATRSFYNWAGCAIGGSNHPATTIAYHALKPFFGAPSASLLGFQGGVRIDAQHAALLNAISSHVHDYDDTHLDTIIHPTGPVASAVLAIAEWKGGISGKDFLLALIAGIEAECKVGLAVWPEHYDVGWHITSTTGSIGAAVGVSKLLSMSCAQTAHAVGIAATQVVGLREMFGSHTKSFHPGRAAQNGLLAAILAQNGYESSQEALESKRGWANVVSLTKDDFQYTSMTEIDRVDLTVHPLVLELTGKSKPRDGLEAKFSVYHGAATALLFGKGTPAQFEDAVVQDPHVVFIRDKVHAVVSESLRADEAKITITLQDGRTWEKHVQHAIGSKEVALTDVQLEEKFKNQCESILKEKLDRVSKALWDVEHAADIRDVTKLLAL
ncbi:2-methylcitrate dehydratase PrpD [Cadophora sp. DSE1049]|nr:2-methylcitrate dehydratase PrpD [Cadophora sp. DSE1049]